MQSSETLQPRKFTSASEAILYFGQKWVTRNGTNINARFDLNHAARLEAYKKAYAVFSGYDSDKLKIKPHKGVLMVGDMGVGKTTLMGTFQIMYKDTGRMFRRVTGLAIKDMLEEYTSMEIKEMYGKDFKCDLFIDDIALGQSNYKVMGNTINILAELIYDRYELFMDEGFKTHLTSNAPIRIDMSAVEKDTSLSNEAKEEFKNAKTLEKMFGNLIIDRMFDMDNLITWEGDSLRRP